VPTEAPSPSRARPAGCHWPTPPAADVAPGPSLCRGILPLAFAFLLVGALASALYLGCAALRWCGLDAAAAAVLNDAASREDLKRVLAKGREVAELRQCRDDILQKVLQGRLSIAEGHAEMREAFLHSPAFERILNGAEAASKEESLTEYYLYHLQRGVINDPAAPIRFDPDFADLLASRPK